MGPGLMGQKEISNLPTEEGRLILADAELCLCDIHFRIRIHLSTATGTSDNTQITMFPKNEKFRFLFIVCLFVFPWEQISALNCWLAFFPKPSKVFSQNISISFSLFSLLFFPKFWPLKIASSRSLGKLVLKIWRRKWQPTPVFLPGESQGRGSLVGCCLRGRTELYTTEVT